MTHARVWKFRPPAGREDEFEQAYSGTGNWARLFGQAPGYRETLLLRPCGVTVGHQAILHGCAVSDDCLIGMGARVLNGAFLGPGCLVGAGALITEGKRFEEGGLIVGSPARLVRPLTDEEKAALRLSASHYAEKAARYASGLRLLR